MKFGFKPQLMEKGMGYEKPSNNLTFYKAFFSPQWMFLIHIILQCLSAKTTSWNKFSSTIASSIICLATNQKFNFSSGKDSLKLKELMDLCTNFSNKVLDLESKVLDIKSTYKAKFEKLENRVESLEEENRVLKELKGVHSTVDSDEPVMKKEESSKQGRKIADIDADVEINLEKVQAKAYNLDLNHQEKVLSMLDVNDEEPDDVEEVLEVVKAAKLITKVMTTVGVGVNAASVQDTPITAAEATKVIVPRKGREAQARRNMMVYLKNMVGYKMSYFKGMSYDEITPLFEKHYNHNQSFLNEVNKGIKVPKQKVSQEKEVEVESSKKEDDDDDVYTNATPLALKIPIVDYKIYTKRNRPYFKIIRADGNHRLFSNFSTMLKNFDREDIESLWKIKDQKGKYGLPKAKSEKLFESCGAHCLTLSTTQIFILVEKMYPLTHFTLEQMVNDVRLEVDDESEMSLKLLRLVRRQLNEGYAPQ
nr:ribonuclease H-like domain, reverse transcriptase, RNA-dependent DNA polymerase [Tanacetum cinerariifolium]